MKLIGSSQSKTVFHLLPLEETLRNDLEQIQFVAGYGILRPRMRYTYVRL